MALVGRDPHVASRTDPGWHPLSKAMTATSVDGMVVKTVDGNFDTNVLEFPRLIERDGLTLARAPVEVDPELGIRFVADIPEGDPFRVGDGNPDVILADPVALQNRRRDFRPQAVFRFTCSGRRFFLLDDVELEALPFEAVAPTATSRADTASSRPSTPN
jgi:hypothetical protein